MLEVMGTLVLAWVTLAFVSLPLRSVISGLPEEVGRKYRQGGMVVRETRLAAVKPAQVKTLKPQLTTLAAGPRRLTLQT